MKPEIMGEDKNMQAKLACKKGIMNSASLIRRFFVVLDSLNLDACNGDKFLEGCVETANQIVDEIVLCEELSSWDIQGWERHIDLYSSEFPNYGHYSIAQAMEEFFRALRVWKNKEWETDEEIWVEEDDPSYLQMRHPCDYSFYNRISFEIRRASVYGPDGVEVMVCRVPRDKNYTYGTLGRTLAGN